MTETDVMGGGTRTEQSKQTNKQKETKTETKSKNKKQKPKPWTRIFSAFEIFIIYSKSLRLSTA